jgi:hypothetical protein
MTLRLTQTKRAVATIILTELTFSSWHDGQKDHKELHSTISNPKCMNK